jgi:hypothetical protein
LVSGITISGFQLTRPALDWVNEAPDRVTQLRQRVIKSFPRLARFSRAAAAVNNLGATEEEKKEAQEKAPVVEVKDSRGTSSILNWTGTFLGGVGETLVLLYLLLASGDALQFDPSRASPGPPWTRRCGTPSWASTCGRSSR